jgi:fructan beta-fructosidase
MSVFVEGRLVHRLECDFPADPAGTMWWGWLDMSGYEGKKATIEAEASEAVRAMVTFGDARRDLVPCYTEALRPQFHMSQSRGWNNDPNGMVYHDGEYHFFWQSNPAGYPWCNMYWGHAVSRDLVHWTELPHALRPFGAGVTDRDASMAQKECFSGSANVDALNTAGWQNGDEKTMVIAFTDTGAGESLAYSNDRGRTWRMHEGNPVVRHTGRDPKLIWYAPGKHWVMAVFDETQGLGNHIAFHTSTDLKAWTLASRLPGYFECPELFELSIDADATQKRWVIFAADGHYAIGSFDGNAFTPEHDGKHQVHWGAFYASQCFSNAPGGRVVQIGWARIDMPGMPFNQAFTLPLELTLRTTPAGVRMFAEPVAEVASLRTGVLGSVTGRTVDPGAGVRVEAPGQLYDVEITLRRAGAGRAEIRLGASTLVYDFDAQRLNDMPLPMTGDEVVIRVLVDRPMFEAVGGHGACYLTAARPDAGKPLGVISVDAPAGTGGFILKSLVVHEMGSIWGPAPGR